MKSVITSILIITLLSALCRTNLCAHGGFDEEIKLTDTLITVAPENGLHWYHRAYLNFLHGDWQIALSDAEKAERLAPHQFPVDWLRAQALEAGGLHEAALTVITDFLTAHPSHPGGLAVRARIFMKLNKAESALVDFREALARMPNAEPDLYLEVADALQSQQLHDEAAQVLASGITKLGNIPSLVLKALDLEIATGRIDLALTRVDAMQSKAPRPEPWMARRAAILDKAGRVAEARTAWQTLADHLAKLPNLERGSHAMSVLAETAEKALANVPPSPPKSKGILHSPAIQVTQKNPKTPFPSRSVLGPGSNYEEELDRMDALILREPANSLYRFQRGELNAHDHKWQWATEDCDETERLAPGKFPVARLKAEILAGQNCFREAETVLDQLISDHPDNAQGYQARARVLLKLDQVKEALADYRSALARTPTPDGNLFQEVGSVLRENGQPEEALQVLNTALEIHKGEPALVRQALDLEVTMHAFDAAVVRVEAMQTTSPQPEIWMAKKADILTQSGRLDEARATWQALQKRLASMPNLQRGSAAMTALQREMKAALTALDSAPVKASSAAPITVTTAPVSLPFNR